MSCAARGRLGNGWGNVDEFGISQLLGAHLREATRAHVVDAVETHHRIHLSEHRILKSPWRWGGDEAHPCCVAVVIATSGTVRLAAASGEAMTAVKTEQQRRAAERGAAVACRSEHRATLWFSGPEPSCVIVWLPNHICADLGIELAEPVQLYESMLLSMLRGVARRSLRTGAHREATLHEDFVLERVLSSLLVGALIEGTGGSGHGQDYQRMEQARTVMLANLTDPEFTVESLADALNISSRQLQRHYSQLGTTPSEVLKELRIEVAQELIRQRPELPRKQIAARAGFRSVAALRRALTNEATGNS